MQKKKEKAFLIGVHWKSEDKALTNESMKELQNLAATAEVEIISEFIQSLEKPKTATYIGTGKLTEIKNKAKKSDVHTLIFNNNLSPSQSRNISDITHCNVVDRTELILDIFARHARTKQAKLQVELAQLEYAYTKLKRKWKHLSRIQGGIGFRGPGETQIEVDRREIQKKMTALKAKLQNIETISRTKRKHRKNILSLALVGYTNAGKSTLFNLLTKEKRYTANKLFATLDAKTRAFFIAKNQRLIITDTIGFIRKLPHRLVKSFHSTLLEVLEADLLLHVVDISQPNLFELIAAVNDVLEEIAVDEKNVLMVFNKIDRIEGVHFKFIKKKLMLEYPDHVFISAKTGDGLERLQQKISTFIQRSKIKIQLEIPFKLPKLLAFVHENAEILQQENHEQKQIYKIKANIDRQLLSTVKKQIEEFKLRERINEI